MGPDCAQQGPLPVDLIQLFVRFLKSFKKLFTTLPQVLHQFANLIAFFFNQPERNNRSFFFSLGKNGSRNSGWEKKLFRRLKVPFRHLSLSSSRCHQEGINIPSRPAQCNAFSISGFSRSVIFIVGLFHPEKSREGDLPVVTKESFVLVKL